MLVEKKYENAPTRLLVPRTELIINNAVRGNKLRAAFSWGDGWCRTSRNKIVFI